MNTLDVTYQQSITTLASHGWSARRIARELKIHRDTVARYLRGGKPKPAKVPDGSAATRSSCEPHRLRILSGVSRGLSAQRIYQDLVTEANYTGSYDAVKRFVRKLCEKHELPFRRMECEPGEECQVDFGQGAWVEENGHRRRPHLFRAVLSFSRKGYAEVVWRQDTETFLRCLENAFRSWGGVGAVTVIDNLKAGVLQADWFDPELNPKSLSFAEHYGTVLMPTKPAMPRHKGKVESGVNFVQSNALKGRRFKSLAEQNAFLAEWERDIADKRLHGVLRQHVGAVFCDVESPALRPLPGSLFPSFVETRRIVHRDGHVEYKRAFYSTPPEYVGRRVWVRADSTMIRIFNDRREQIGVHVRREHGFGTDPQHIHEHKRNGIERGADYLLNRCRAIGPASGAWAEAMLKQRGVYGLRPLQGLLSLSRKHPAEALESAAVAATERGLWHLRELRSLLPAEGIVVQGVFLQQHPLIRDLSAYRVAFPS